MKKELPVISQSQLVKKLKRDRKIDYLAIVTSSWHYLSALSTIMWLKQKKGVAKGIILVSEHVVDGQIINETLMDISRCEEFEIYNFRFGALATDSEVNQYLWKHKSVGRPFYILKPVIPKLAFSVHLFNSGIRRNIVHITLEEGLATYMRDWKMWALEERANGDIVELWKQFKNRVLIKEFSEFALKKKGEFIENTLFVKRNNVLIQNKRCIHYFRKLLEELSSLYDCSKYDYYKNSIIICTQPYSEQNKILQDADIVVIRKFCELAKTKGIQVVIKPHPREKKLEKYQNLGAIVDLQNDVPLELVLAGVTPKAIVGITTTTLVTAKLFWKIPAISIACILERDSYQEEFVKEIDNFCNTFENYVSLPKDFFSIHI